MDRDTGTFYARHARTLAVLYSQNDVDYGFPWQDAFPIHGSRILDVGCGPGRDLAKLLSLGYDAYGIEPVAEMAREAVIRHAELTGRVFSCALPLPREHEPFGTFEGIICSAVLMHIPEMDLPDAVADICALLNDGGRLVVSVPSNREASGERRNEEPRLFVPADIIFRNLLRPDLSILRRIEHPDSLGRSLRWITAILEYSASHDGRAHASRPPTSARGCLERSDRSNR